MKPKKQQKLSFSTTPKPPPVIPEKPAQAQGGREQEDESYEELMVDSLVSIATGLDGSLDEDSPERLTIREVYDYSRVKLMLHHPFVNVDDLKVVDGIQYDSFTTCRENYVYPEPDFYDNPLDDEPPEDDDDDSYEIEEPEEDLVQSNGGAFAARVP